MWSEVAPFLVACLVIELTPGPNMAYLAVLSAQRGPVAGFVATAGIAAGLLAAGFLASIGFGQLLQQSPAAFQALRWAGVAYLLYLAWDCWREATAVQSKPVAAFSLADAFRRGLVTNLLNPKAYLFYITVVPPFAARIADIPTGGVLLVILYVGVATLVHLGVAMGAGRLAGLLARPDLRRGLGVGAAVALMGVAIWVALFA